MSNLLNEQVIVALGISGVIGPFEERCIDYWCPGWLSRYGDSLQTGRPGDWSPVGGETFRDPSELPLCPPSLDQRPTALLPPRSNGKPEAATVVVAPDDGHEDARNMLSCI
jgi:hypothetical protein